ncbi:MAG: hypothetical protein RLY50_720, partial [Actinomycetota bacterium]
IGVPGRDNLRWHRNPRLRWETVTVGEEAQPTGLQHVVVAAGTLAEWADMTVADWTRRLQLLGAGATAGGARWVTLLPHGGPALPSAELNGLLSLIDGTGKVQTVHSDGSVRRASQRDDGMVLIVDPAPDGHERMAAAVRRLCADGRAVDEIDEASLASAILEPAWAEPDLVVAIGPPDRLPESLVWELGYSEIVFLDLGWKSLSASHLELAIDDFNRRHRRFGGLDS